MRRDDAQNLENSEKPALCTDALCIEAPRPITCIYEPTTSFLPITTHHHKTLHISRSIWITSRSLKANNMHMVSYQIALLIIIKTQQYWQSSNEFFSESIKNMISKRKYLFLAAHLQLSFWCFSGKFWQLKVDESDIQKSPIS